jgi:hypothetical protein
MTRIFLALAALLAAAPALAAERRYTVTDFDRVQVEGPYEVVLATGRAPGAAATGTAEALDRVSVSVEGRTLKVRVNRSAWAANPAANPGPVRVVLSGHAMRSASVSGSGSLAVDKMSGLRLDLAVAGSGRIAVAKLEADMLSATLVGSGRMELAGAAKQLRATISGSGDFAAAGLKVEDAVIGADTAGAIALAGGRTVKLRVTGAGDIDISGDPACTIEGSSSGRLRCGRLAR